MNSLLNVRNIIIALVIVIFVGLVLGGSYTVNERERGVVLRNGHVTSVESPGLHIKLPVVDHVVFLPVTQQSTVFSGMQTYTTDSQIVTLKVSVTYHVPDDKVGVLYSKYGSIKALEDNLIARQIPTQVKDVFGLYDAKDVVAKRTKLGTDLETSIRAALIGPLVVDSVQLENIDFDKVYEDNIRDMMTKNVEIQTQANETKRQAEVNTQNVNKAKAVADSQIATATANAAAVKMQGEAEAYAIRVKAEALAQNQNLIDLTRVERWDGKLPTTMVPGSAIPFLDVTKK